LRKKKYDAVAVKDKVTSEQITFKTFHSARPTKINKFRLRLVGGRRLALSSAGTFQA
jgi:hypothetical protein